MGDALIGALDCRVPVFLSLIHTVVYLLIVYRVVSLVALRQYLPVTWHPKSGLLYLRDAIVIQYVPMERLIDAILDILEVVIHGLHLLLLLGHLCVLPFHYLLGCKRSLHDGIHVSTDNFLNLKRQVFFNEIVGSLDNSEVVIGGKFDSFHLFLQRFSRLVKLLRLYLHVIQLANRDLV